MIASVFGPFGHALNFSFAMTWEILWALILGFALSAVVQSVVSKAEMTRLLPDDSPRHLALATALGAASSSCSYAAVALARSKGTRAMPGTPSVPDASSRRGPSA